jgi:Zn-dependent protease/predicted transcriptional regulator
MSALPIARLFGFEIRLHVSWALILALITVTVATQVEALAPNTSSLVRWTIGGVTSFVFLLSGLAHELGHALAARRAGMPGGPVVVFFFGGAANPTLEARTPRDEIVSALAGPVISLAIGAAFLLIAAAGGALGNLVDGVQLVIAEIAFFVGVMNVILGTVNLIPAFPLDGGRIARGIAWARTGDPDAGLRFAGVTGRRVGLTLAMIGFLVVVFFAQEHATDGLMLALCGWFLVSSGRTIERMVDLDALLDGIRVADVMDHDIAGVPPGLTLDTFAGQLLDGSGGGSLAVLRGSDLLGMVGAAQVRRVRRDRWANTRVEDLMVSGEALPEVAPDTTLRAAFDQLRRSGLDGLPVLDAGRLTGIVTRRAITEAIRAQLQSAAKVTP